MKLSVINQNSSRELAAVEGCGRIHLVYGPAYCKGDAIRITDVEPGFYEVRLEDTLPPSLIYIEGTEALFPIPFGVDRAGFSPRSFTGKRHFIEVRKAEQPDGCRNLAFNPHDQTDNQGIYPHMVSNVAYADSLRNRIFPDRGLFAPRNVIDGILANESHRLYPHQSWGINRMEDAYLKVEFARPVDITMLRLAIRCEFPHDNYWVRGTVQCSDGSEEVIEIRKTDQWQSFPIRRHGITSLTLAKLIRSEEPSEFPALSLLEVYGTEAEKTEKGELDGTDKV